MNRRQYLTLFIPQIIAPAEDDPKLVIEFDANYRPKRIVFTAVRSESVFNLTRQLLPIGVSPFYGPSFIMTLGWINFSHNPGWNYFVNSALPPRPAGYVSAKPGDHIEWRLGKHPA